MIIFVDDEKPICDLFESIIGSLVETPVFTFESAEDGINFALANDISFFISDYRMPVMNGLEVLQKVSHLDCPLLLITGDIDINLPDDLKDRVQVLPKPIDFEYLAKILKG